MKKNIKKACIFTLTLVLLLEHSAILSMYNNNHTGFCVTEDLINKNGFLDPYKLAKNIFTKKKKNKVRYYQVHDNSDESDEETTIETLPKEMLYEIASFLDAKSLQNMRALCKAIYNALDKKILQINIDTLMEHTKNRNTKILSKHKIRKIITNIKQKIEKEEPLYCIHKTHAKQLSIKLLDSKNFKQQLYEIIQKEITRYKNLYQKKEKNINIKRVAFGAFIVWILLSGAFNTIFQVPTTIENVVSIQKHAYRPNNEKPSIILGVIMFTIMLTISSLDSSLDFSKNPLTFASSTLLSLFISLIFFYVILQRRYSQRLRGIYTDEELKKIIFNTLLDNNEKKTL